MSGINIVASGTTAWMLNGIDWVASPSCGWFYPVSTANLRGEQGDPRDVPVAEMLQQSQERRF